MRITFRPNLFGRSFGRKLGVLCDDYVKDVFVSACVINKREDDIVLHTQEVTGSSPVAPTIHFRKIRTEGRVGGSSCDVDCDVRSQFDFLSSDWLVAEGPPIRPLSGFSSAVRL